MEQFQIARNINNQVCLFILTETELELAYRIKQRQYMNEDFANALADNSQDPNYRFPVGHLEEFPELMNSTRELDIPATIVIVQQSKPLSLLKFLLLLILQ